MIHRPKTLSCWSNPLLEFDVIIVSHFRARVFIGNLNTTLCTRVDLIDLCQPYGNLKALSLLKGYAFVQYETQTEAEMAIQILHGYSFHNQKLGK